MEYGVQLFTLRKYLKSQENFPSVFERLRDMGAEVIQISATGEFDSKFVGKLTRDLGLKVCATHSKFERIENDLDRLAEEHLDLGCGEIGISMLPKKYNKKSLDDAKRFAEFLNVTGERLKNYGQKIAYHNHWFEFNKIDTNRTLFDVLREETSDNVNFILDTYWIKVGKQDPATYIDKFLGRVKTVHLKDYKKKAFLPLIKPLGEGTLDFVDILSHAEKAGAEYAVIELDFSKDPFGDLEKSLKYLKSI